MNDSFILKEWVPALRSGEYKQGRGGLKWINHDGEATFCCLGVACDLLVKRGVLPAWQPGSAGPIYEGIPSYNDGTGIESCALPEIARNYLGTGNNNARVEFEGKLVAMNDSGGTFNEIADFIEEWIDKKTKGGKAA